MAALTLSKSRVVNSPLNVAMHFQNPEMVYGVSNLSIQTQRHTVDPDPYYYTQNLWTTYRLYRYTVCYQVVKQMATLVFECITQM